MCGIIASIKTRGLCNYLLAGLKKEDYRGYDSCGVGLLNNNKIEIIKAIGKIDCLEKKINKDEFKIGIGHTRWATHGKNTIENAHPHISNHELFALVHNGTIYNYAEIKKELIDLGFCFYSETDSEVIVNLLEYEYGLTLDIKATIEKVMQKLKGTYAICFLFAYEEKIYFFKNQSPLILALENDCYTILSDFNAIDNANRFIDIDDNEYGYITDKNYLIYKNGKKIKKNLQIKEKQTNDLTLNNYKYYMEKEIDEIPLMAMNLNKHILKEDLTDIIKAINNTYGIVFIASGTSFNACLISRSYFLCQTEVILASEFYNTQYKVDKNKYYIFISQSGETMDVLKSLAYVNQKTKNILAITNVKYSTLYKKAHSCILLYAEKEIAVASTKAYINEVILLYYLSLLLNNSALPREFDTSELEMTNTELLKIQSIAKDLTDKNNAFFIGKGLCYYLALEASLKLKEVSYIHSEAIYAGELKHGSIALIEDGFPVFVIRDYQENEYLSSAIEEIKARGGVVYEFKYDSNKKLGFLKTMIKFFYLSFYTALYKKREIDKPRNLAKSVTVE